MSYLTLGQATVLEASGGVPTEYVEDLWEDPASGEVLYEPLPPEEEALFAEEPEMPSSAQPSYVPPQMIEPPNMTPYERVMWRQQVLQAAAARQAYGIYY